MKRDEWFQCVRWINLAIGLYNIYYYVGYGSWPMLCLGALNIGVWVFTRQGMPSVVKIKEKSQSS